MGKPFLCARRGCLIGISIIIFSMGVTFSVINSSPATAAHWADSLRDIFGDKAVAQLEMVVFQVQDQFQKWEYKLGLKKVAPPWIVTAKAPILESPTPTEIDSTIPPPLAFTPTPTTVIPSVHIPLSVAETPSPTVLVPSPTLVPSRTPSPTPTTIPSPTPSPTPTDWRPINLTPMGSLKGEGIWTEYIRDSSGRVISYRTFLQPDPSRPYSVVAVVAFDLSHTRLHFILGSVEPYAKNAPKRTGAMPAADRVPGVLMAMFNGGFKAVHGQFGAMSDGVVALPPKDGLGTIAIYKDGQVRMGVWGEDIKPSADLQAWRENGPPVIHNGKINPLIYDNSPKDWGYTVSSYSPTWRSGVGISQDGQTLYYFAGSSLTMEPLAKVMIRAQAWEAIQLDINAYWVHFVAVRTDGKSLSLEPLFPDMMKENIDRYLYAYTRDYFYITAAP